MWKTSRRMCRHFSGGCERLSHENPRAILAGMESSQVLCDGLQIASVRGDILRQIAAPSTHRTGARLVGIVATECDPEELERASATSRLITGEQSNSSVAYGDRWFFKLFRKFEPGPHPDLEVTRFLTEERSFKAVPTFAGALKLIDARGESLVGLLTSMTQNQGDGWGFTVDAVARYFDRVLAARVEVNAANAATLIGSVYPERAHQLGVHTSELHLALASNLDRADFSPEPFTAPYQRSLYQGMRGSAGRILRELRQQIPSLPEAVRKEAAEVAVSQGPVFVYFSQLLKRRIEAVKTRVHGDFHLGQTLNTGKDFVIIDFEGEPRKPLSERSLKRSPLVDVAGMLRSFDYAASAALARETEADAQRLAAWVRPWVEATWSSYLTGYLSIARGASFLPADPADGRLLLESFLLDKAIYEIGYERSYRPDFLPIPLRAVARLVSARSAGLEVWK